MEKRFTALRIVAVLFRIAAWVTLVTGVLSGVGILIGALLDSLDTLTDFGLPALTPLGGVVGFLALLIVALIQFALLHATADFFNLFIALEENTRAIRQWQERQGMAGTQPVAYPSMGTPYTPPPYSYPAPTQPTPPPPAPVPPEFPQPR